MSDETRRGEPPGSGNVRDLSSADHREHLRIVEAILFASAEPLAPEVIAARMPSNADVPRLLHELQALYAGHGVNLVRIAGWAFRTAEDLGFLLRRDTVGAAPPDPRRAGNPLHHRLSPAGDPRRDRGDPRRRDVEGNPRRSFGDRLGSHARPAAGRRAAR